MLFSLIELLFFLISAEGIFAFRISICLIFETTSEVRSSHVYCPSGTSDAIMALINNGADVAAEDKDGLTGSHT